MSFFSSLPPNTKYDEFDSQYYNHILSLMHLSKPEPNGKLLLDVGCASGAWGIRLAEKGFTVIGIDISKAFIKSSRDWAKVANVDFNPILCDIDHLPIKAGGIQVCFCGYVLHHFRCLDFVVAELSSVLEDGGPIFAVEPNGSNMIHKLSRGVMTALPQRWVMSKGIATSNERVHEINSFIKIFNKNELSEIRFITINREKPSSHEHPSIVVKLLVAGRKILFNSYQRISVGPTGKTELLIHALKKSTRDSKNN